jgi:hypothetical protein
LQRKPSRLCVPGGGLSIASEGHGASTIHDGEEACIVVHYRLAAWRASACWQPLQLHVGPQLQTSPHWHEAAGRSAAVWHPQVHSEPVQVAQAHTSD